MPLGLYISVPFCRTKCSYCNFASGVFSASQMAQYVERLSADVRAIRGFAAEHGAEIPEPVDTIYLGGGTPSLLPPDELKKLFFALKQEFKVLPKAEITVECAPGTLTDQMIQAMVTRGVNRVSLGVQSFVDKEAASVGRLHTGEKIMNDIARLRQAGISNINVDLIAGLPHQTRESWDYSLDQAIASGIPHVSVYMLEVDEDSRLGRELIAGGTKYHAHHVPDDDLTAEFYETACARLNEAGIEQYEISNFARKVGDLILLNPCSVQPFACSLIKIRRQVIVGNKVCVIFRSSSDQFASQARVLIHFKHVHAHMRDAGRNRLLQRIFPALSRLVRQAGNQIDIDIADPGLAQPFDIAQSLFPRVQPRH